MIDFHTHILPAVDDGAKTVYESIEMLVAERKQGIGHVFLTPRYCAAEETPSEFVQRRDASFQKLTASISENERVLSYMPKLYLGAEVSFFPGMSDCDQLRQLALGDTGCILVEPPMTFWTESVLDELEAVGTNLGLVPVIAHAEEYFAIMKNQKLPERLQNRKILNQVNASFFLGEETKTLAVSMLENDAIHLMGSGCCNAGQKKPNLGIACQKLADEGHAGALNRSVRRMYQLIENR